MFSSKFRTYISLVILFLLVTNAPGQTGHKGWPTTAVVTWSQTSVPIGLFAGGQASRTISFTTDRNIQDVVVQVSGTASTFISASPQSFAVVEVNQPKTLSVQFSVPSGILNGNYEGTISLISGTRTLVGVVSVLLQVGGTATSGTISPSGGTLALSQVATISFPSGAFPNGAFVTLAALSSPATQFDYLDTGHVFAAGSRLSYEIKIDTSTIPIQTSFEILANVPDDFIQSLPANAEVRLFAQILEDGGEETLDSIELFDAIFDPANKTIRAVLPDNAFTRRRTDLSYEAIIIIGTTPTRTTLQRPPVENLNPSSIEGKPLASSNELNGKYNPGGPSGASDSSRKPQPTEAIAICQGSTIGPPLAGNLIVNSPFNPTVKHFGTDYRAANGTTVMSVANGTVEKIGLNIRQLPSPDPRSGKLIKGWGRYVVILHTDGSRSVYGHLIQSSTDILTQGQAVTRGQAIGQADNTGGSTADHLHLEYIPNGLIHENDKKIDPNPCIGATQGSIVVRDNGPVADDAFSVEFDNVLLGQTQTGGSSNFAVNNLIPGTHSLKITAVIAPDNAGTYEITLSDGLTFVGGGTVRSGTLSLGGSAVFGVIVPTSNLLGKLDSLIDNY
jgi:murein DD-endopeptidase MepM/ murein hydrolase activator NlpD